MDSMKEALIAKERFNCRVMTSIVTIEAQTRTLYTLSSVELE